MMRIVLAGGYDTQNLGDHAMLVVLREQLERRFGEVKITLLSRHPDSYFDESYDVQSIPNLDHASREDARGKWFRCLNGEEDTVHLEDISNAIGQADLFVIGGGRMLVDYTHGFQRGHLAYFVQLTTLARFLGTPMMLYAHSLEPLATESGAEHLRFLAANAAGISVREQPSQRVLTDLGIDPALVEIIPDPAFGLSLVPPYIGPKLPAIPQDGRPLLAVNVRSYAWRDGDVSAFEEQLAQLLDRVIAATDARLLCVPQMTYAVDSAETDDRAVARRIAARMEHSADVLTIEQPLLVEEALGIYGHVTALLSMRRHGMLFAASQGVPVMPLSAERNADYMASTLGIEDCGVDLADVERSVATVSRVLRNSRELGRDIAERTAEVGEDIPAYAELAARILSSGSSPVLEYGS